MIPALRLVDPALLPNVWRVPELARAEDAVFSTGHSTLDAQLPGGGWPVGSMVEVLQAQAGQHVWQLLLPGLAQAIRRQPGPVVLMSAPFEPFGPSLGAQGLPAERLLCVRAGKPQARLWATEQALRCADVVAVMAWLPQSKGAELRRLHMAAQQHDKLLFVFRGLNARQDSSPARLRLMVEGGDTLQVHILKRRGPPLESPLVLPAYPARLAALLDARKGRTAPALDTLLRNTPEVAPANASEGALASASPVPLHRRSHVLDRPLAIT